MAAPVTWYYSAVPGFLIPGLAVPGEPPGQQQAPPAPASRWLYYSSVPAMQVPGMACPGMAGTAGYPMWIYIGLPLAACYLDYLDLTVPRTLSVVTGQWYAMLVANSRTGLTIPPPDHRWAPAAGVTFSSAVFFRAYRVFLAEARAHNARHLAARAARPVTYPPPGPPPPPTTPPPRPVPPDLAAGRAHNSRRHALAARGEHPDGG